MTIVHAIRHNAPSTLLINSLNKQNAIWTSRTNAIYQFKKHLGKLPAGLEEQAASSDETTGLLPDTVKVYLLSKLLYPPPNPSVRLLGSQGLKRLSVQTPNVRLRQKHSKFVSMSFWLERRKQPFKSHSPPQHTLVTKSDSDRILAPKLLQFLHFRISVGSLSNP